MRRGTIFRTGTLDCRRPLERSFAGFIFAVGGDVAAMLMIGRLDVCESKAVVRAVFCREDRSRDGAWLEVGLGGGGSIFVLAPFA